MKLRRPCVTILALSTLLAFPGCGNGDVDEPEDGSLAAVAEAYGEGACPSTPDQSFAGLLPDAGITTPTTYSNSHCFKAYVVNVASWPSQRAELVVTDPFVDNAAWHAPNPRPRKMPPPPALSQTDCENLFLSATVYENGIDIWNMAERGQWDAAASRCLRPTVILGGLKRAFDIIDEVQFKPGNTYAFSATYRTFDGTSAPTLPFKILTPINRCGLLGESCCTPSTLKPFSCEDATTCVSGKCAACGSPGEICCDSLTSGTFDTCPAELNTNGSGLASQCVAGVCTN